VWTKFYLDFATPGLSAEPQRTVGSVSFDALGEGITFLTPPMAEELEFAGPMMAKLRISSSTVDADLFVVVRLFDPDGKEVVFKGTVDPHTPIAQGWLRASHRKLDPAKTLPYRPYHSHDERWPLKPGVPVDLDIEIWPSGVVVPPGYRIGFTVRGRDYEYAGEIARLSSFKNDMKGCGPFLHDDTRDRPPAIYGGTTTLHNGSGHEPYLLLPVIPPKTSNRQ
jgi:predicted acyl esterase